MLVRVLFKEAEWIAFHLQQRAYLLPELRLVNLGSSTGHFRSIQQPYIDELIFRPLINSDALVKIWHLDMEHADGVDRAVDATRPEAAKVYAEINPNTDLISNLLEHVSDIGAVLRNLEIGTSSDVEFVITGPLRFPHHADPIDNGFRPRRSELESLLRDCGFKLSSYAEVAHATLVSAVDGSPREYLGAVKMMLSGQVRQSARTFFPVSAFCAVAHHDLSVVHAS